MYLATDYRNSKRCIIDSLADAREHRGDSLADPAGRTRYDGRFTRQCTHDALLCLPKPLARIILSFQRKLESIR